MERTSDFAFDRWYRNHHEGVVWYKWLGRQKMRTRAHYRVRIMEDMRYESPSRSISTMGCISATNILLMPRTSTVRWLYETYHYPDLTDDGSEGVEVFSRLLQEVL